MIIKMCRSIAFKKKIIKTVGFSIGAVSLLLSALVAHAQSLPVITAYQPPIHQVVDPVSGFVHPGVGVTKEVLENLRTQIAAQQEPWFSYYKDMLESPAASRTITSSNESSSDPTAPAHTGFASQGDNSRFIADSLKVYTQSLMYYITGDEVYRENAMRLVRIWAQMNPAQYAYFSDAHIHTGIPLNRMLTGAEILRYTDSQIAALDWTENDTLTFTNNLVIPVIETFQYEKNHFMNQHLYPLMGAMAGYIFTDNKPRYEEAVEWMTVNAGAVNQGFNGSIQQLFRLVDTDAATGLPVSPPRVQHVEMGRDQAHGGGDLNNAAIIARMFLAQNTLVDPLTGELSTAGNAVDIYQFLDDRILAAADYFWRFMIGYETPWTPTPFSMVDGDIWGIYYRLSDAYRGRLLTANFWDVYYYYTYVRNENVEQIAPYFYEAFKKRVPTIYYHNNGFVNNWGNVDGGTDFWIYIPQRAAVEEGAAHVPRAHHGSRLIEVDELYTSLDQYSETLGTGESAYIRLTARPSPNPAEIALFNISFNNSHSSTIALRVRTHGAATLALAHYSGDKPYRVIELPDTNNQWWYVAFTVPAVSTITWLTAEGNNSLVDIDHINVNIMDPAGNFTPPAFIQGNEPLVIYSYVGAPLELNFTATDAGVTDQLNYQSADLPAGASLDAANGVFSWTPSQAGSYAFIVSVDDGDVMVTKRVSVIVAADRVAAIDSIVQNYDDQEIYTSSTLAAYTAVFNTTVAMSGGASNHDFAAQLLLLQQAVRELKLVTPLLEDGSMNFPAMVASSTFGNGVGVLIDSNDDTFTGFLRYANPFHTLDFGLDYKVSVTEIGIQARMNFADRGAGVTVFASNDNQNWQRITPGESLFQGAMTMLPVDSAFHNERYRYLKFQMVTHHPDALRREYQNIMELAEIRIRGQAYESGNQIAAIEPVGNPGVAGLIGIGDTLEFTLTAKEPIANLQVQIQGVNAVATSSDGIHWQIGATLNGNVRPGTVSYYVQYITVSSGASLDAFIESDLYLINKNDLIENIPTKADLIDPSTTAGRPDPAVTLQQVNYLFDNNPATSSDFRLAGNGSGGYIAFDFRENGSVALTAVDVLARQDTYFGRANGTVIQGSNDGINWATISSAAQGVSQWQTLTINNSAAFRFIRIFNSNAWFGNLAEVKFHGSYLGPVDYLDAISLSPEDTANTSGLVLKGDRVLLSIVANEPLASLQAKIQGVDAAVTSQDGIHWQAAAVMDETTADGFIQISVECTAINTSPCIKKQATTDSSKLYLVDGANLVTLDFIENNVALLDPSTTGGRPNPVATLAELAKLFDGKPATSSDFRAGSAGSNAYIGFDFGDDSGIWLSSVDVLARPDQLARIRGVVVQGSSDGTSWTTISNAAIQTAEWQTLVINSPQLWRYVRIFNNANWFGNLSELRLHTDNTAPVTGDNAPAGWVNQDVSLTLVVEDNAAGVAITHYQINQGTVQTGNQFVISEEGEHQVSYWSEDRAGNTETTKTVPVKIDKTLPEIDVLVNGRPLTDNNNLTGSQQLEIVVTDALSGIGLLTIKVDGDDQPVNSSGATLIDLGGFSGSHEILILVEDNAGNSLSDLYLFSVTAGHSSSDNSSSHQSSAQTSSTPSSSGQISSAPASSGNAASSHTSSAVISAASSSVLSAESSSFASSVQSDISAASSLSSVASENGSAASSAPVVESSSSTAQVLSSVASAAPSGSSGGGSVGLFVLFLSGLLLLSRFTL
ncbi:hypothetical protein C4F51_15405 [Cellvibrio sp. KB43]|uniref:F5/8 type C domain-containing protein n=1 Tax=Cellvibrio polysaccharolyticus TaxID=2082724 RepID=A0A928V8R4_9GAMM|nr:hypothetical protein [Cellvibrio polysaccharolyticus]